jgi:hypothetical protein
MIVLRSVCDDITYSFLATKGQCNCHKITVMVLQMAIMVLQNNGYDVTELCGYVTYSFLATRRECDCHRIPVMVFRNKGHGVTKKRIWCYRITVMVLQNNGNVLQSDDDSVTQ